MFVYVIILLIWSESKTVWNIWIKTHNQTVCSISIFNVLMKTDNLRVCFHQPIRWLQLFWLALLCNIASVHGRLHTNKIFNHEYINNKKKRHHFGCQNFNIYLDFNSTEERKPWQTAHKVYLNWSTNYEKLQKSPQHDMNISANWQKYDELGVIWCNLQPIWTHVTSTTCLRFSISGANSFSRLMMRPEGTETRLSSAVIHLLKWLSQCILPVLALLLAMKLMTRGSRLNCTICSAQT